MESKNDIVEKRVKPTVIRRRAKIEPPAEQASVPEEKVVLSGAEENPSKTIRKTESAPQPVVEEKKSAPVLETPTPVSAPPAPAPKKIEQEEDRPRFGLKVVGKIDLKPSSRDASKPEAKAPAAKVGEGTVFKPVSIEEEEEAKKNKVKKVVKKTRRDELEVDLEGIGKVATLTQLTRLAAATVPQRVERERIFEPGRNSRKKKSVKKDFKKPDLAPKKASKRIIKIDEAIVVADFAHEMGVKSSEIIKKLMALGSMVTLNQAIDFDTATLVAHDYGYEVKKTGFEESQVINTSEDKAEDLEERPAVVTVMGHVDHGKTSLLDAIRKAQVAAGEAGGITQHIGAYQVKHPKGLITFLDTPGHEAFTAMRARGASVTDIVILVVAADEGIRPQTIEAIHHAKAAEVPIIVAINKIDKPEADLERVKRQLAEHQLVPEEWGGDTIYAPVSAKALQGIEELLEMILLQAEVLELKANPKKMAKGVVIESRLDRGKGPVATVLIQEGTLHAGDSVIAGVHFGRVRAMHDDQGREIKEAGPSVPVEILGLPGVPNAGEVLDAVSEDGMAKVLAEHRENKEKQQKVLATSRASLEDLFKQVQEGETQELKLLLKGDVQGSVEAIRDALLKLPSDKVRVTLLHSGVGGITESDIMLASASNAIVIGFNVRPDNKALSIAEHEKVEVKVYNIIYNVLDDIKKAMEGLLAPTLKEKYLGRAEVRNTFNISKIGTIAGCFVVDGSLTRNAKVRLLRDSVIVYDGKLNSLKRFKDDAKEVQQGYECGMGLENFNDIKVGDIIEAYVVESIAAKL